MKTQVTNGLLLAMTIAVGGCSGGGAGEALKTEQLAIQKEMLAILESVQDPTTADQAILKLEQVADRLGATLRKIKDLSLSADEGKKLAAQFGKEQQELEAKLDKAARSAGLAAGPAQGQKIAETLLRSLPDGQRGASAP